MKFFLVGGAVRDQLMGINPQERDWVVVGGDIAAMQRLNFKQVGKDFPVFLHPHTKEEYALARTERKTAPGYKGFTVNASPEVTLNEDLQRRDLTINAMAQDENGNLVDPYGGRRDLADKVLRHVSTAFSEDPVRILRVARFAARFHHLGFRIADETLQLMREMVANGEINALIAERVWKDSEKALSTADPQVFFEVLRDCNALEILFPEIHALFGVPQPEKHHPEIDSGVHTLLVLKQAAMLSSDLPTRFAALVHDLGKGVTPRDQWPKHVDHEEKGVPLIKALCRRLRIPNEYRDLAMHVCRYHLHVHRAAEIKSSTLLKVLNSVDAMRRPQRFEAFLTACEADARGRTGYEDRDYPQAEIYRSALRAVLSTDVKLLLNKGYEGSQLQQQIRQSHIRAIRVAVKSLQRENKNNSR